MDRVFDGTGYGPDATIWGGELLLGSYLDVARVGFVRPVWLPGGDAAIRRPARTALAHLRAAGLPWEPDLAPVAAAAGVELGIVGRMLDSHFGCVPTTSMGRVFDAISSLLGVCHDVDYEGQAAIELEGLAARAAQVDDLSWAWSITGSAHPDDPLVLAPQGPLASAVAALRTGAPVALAARAFHESVVDMVVNAAREVRRVHGTTTVGLTGGVFQNALLLNGAQERLAASGFRVLTHRVVPANDGGLALGQVAVVAAREAG
jgi:hydrogenase maturation protein HypF